MTASPSFDEPSRAINVSHIPFGAGAIPSKDSVGSKAYNLMRMARAGLPVPPGFVLSTDLCRDFLNRGVAALRGVDAVLQAELRHLERKTGTTFGDPRRPLLVSVRSGAAVSMPGMMETVLNVGLNDRTLRGLVRMTGNPRLAYDCRRRLVQQYGEVVHHMAPALFASRLASLLAERGYATLDEADSNTVRELGAGYESAFATAVGDPLPDDPHVQLRATVEAVLRSWSSAQANEYCRLNDIPDDIGTAVIVQAMVFGNRGPTSGSGVGFTRNPGDGRKELYVDFLANAQGEDVVAGRRRAKGIEELRRTAPDAHARLLAVCPQLEREFGDMQDFEFTVEDGRLHVLQCRAGKRTPLAALAIAADLVDEGMIAPADGLRLVDGLALGDLQVISFAAKNASTPLLTGTPASAGVAVGAIVFDPARIGAVAGRSVILVRENAETGDIHALSQAAALVTVHGARTSHAAVVARQLGKVCVVACSALTIDPSGRKGTFGGTILNEGDIVSVDGATGQVFRGPRDVVTSRSIALLDKVAQWRA